MNSVQLKCLAEKSRLDKLNEIKVKLSLLYILNVIDICMTLMLLQTGKFREVNVIMQVAFNSVFLTIALKLALPLALVVLIYQKAKKMVQLKYLSIKAIELCIVVYGFIDIVHFAYTISIFI